MSVKVLSNLFNDETLVKSSDGLRMYGYTDRNDMNTTSKLLNNIITDENNNVLHYSGKFMDEVNIKDLKSTEEIYAFPEGTFLKVFLDSTNTWRVGTNRCLDASKASFSSRSSFKKMFDELVEEDFYSKLDTNYCYCYVVKHMDSRIVLPVDKNEVVLLSKISLETFKVEFNKDYLVDNLDHDFLIVKEDGEYKRAFSDKYLRMRELKIVNSPNVLTRMVELITKTPELTSEYLTYFPEHINEYKFTLNCINNLLTEVFRDYISLKVKKNYNYFHTLYYQILQRIHNHYRETGIHVSKDVVKDVVFNTNSNVLRLVMFSSFVE